MARKSSSASDGTGSRRSSARSATTAPSRLSRRSRAAAAVDEDLPVTSAGRAGLGGLLRGPGSVLGGLSGIDGATRSLDRLSRAAERGADFLEHLEAEVGLDRAVDLVDRLETLVMLLEGRGALADRLRHLVHAVEGIHHSMEEIEAMVADLHAELLPAPPRRRTAAKTARTRR
jgi:hypothetical protein